MKDSISPRDLLRNSFENGNIAPAYVFSGPDEKKLEEEAIFFASILNCAGPEKAPCLKCASCIKISRFSHPDVRFMDLDIKETNVGIDEIRLLKGLAGLKPYEGKAKVFIVRKAHMMSEEAANALLKTLEEPPGDSVIILLSPSTYYMMPTILSRSRIVRILEPGSDIKDSLPTLGEEIDSALMALRDALIFKATSGTAGRASFDKLGDDIDTLMRLKEALDYNANQKTVKDVLLNTMKGYRDV